MARGSPTQQQISDALSGKTGPLVNSFDGQGWVAQPNYLAPATPVAKPKPVAAPAPAPAKAPEAPTLLGFGRSRQNVVSPSGTRSRRVSVGQPSFASLVQIKNLLGE